jgi:hypothetical protein
MKCWTVFIQYASFSWGPLNVAVMYTVRDERIVLLLREQSPKNRDFHSILDSW